MSGTGKGLDWIMAKTKNIKERLRQNKQAKRGQVTDVVSVYIGADLQLVREYERLTEQLEKLDDSEQVARARRLDSADGARATIEARLAEIRQQIDGWREDFTVRGLDDKHLDRLIAANPPRKREDGSVEPADQRAGWNIETFPEALARACVIDPELDAEDWLNLVGDGETMGQLSSGQLDQIASKALTASKSFIDLPFWPAASTTTQNS